MWTQIEMTFSIAAIFFFFSAIIKLFQRWCRQSQDFHLCNKSASILVDWNCTNKSTIRLESYLTHRRGFWYVVGYQLVKKFLVSKIFDIYNFDGDRDSTCVRYHKIQFLSANIFNSPEKKKEEEKKRKNGENLSCGSKQLHFLNASTKRDKVHRSDYSDGGPYTTGQRTFRDEEQWENKERQHCAPLRRWKIPTREAAQKIPYGVAYRTSRNRVLSGKQNLRILPVDKAVRSVTFKRMCADVKHAWQEHCRSWNETFDAVNIYGFNSPYWFMGTFGAILGGGVVAGVYPTDTPEQVTFQSETYGSAIADR